MSFSYQDIYQNPYIQFFVLHIDKDDFELITTSFSDLKEYKNIKNKGYISKMVNSRNRINEKIIFLHVSNTEEICDLMHSFLD